MAAEIVRQEAFEDVQLTVIEHEGEEWFTAEDIGKALGFADPNRSVRKIFYRNRDEFAGISCGVRLTPRQKNDRKVSRNVRVFNLQAVYKISFFADTPRAKAVRHWASHMLTKGMEKLRLALEDAAGQAARLQKDKANLQSSLSRARKQLAAAKQPPLALPAPAPPAPGSDREPIPVRRGLLKTLRSCLSSHNPRNCRAGAAIVQALLDGQEPPDVLELYKLPQGLLKRDNYRKTKVWKVLAEHDDAEAEQAREEIKAIAFYTQAAMNFYEDMHQGFSMFDREVWNIARESADNELPRM